MSATYFAEIGSDGLVVRVIVSDFAFTAKLGGDWVETFMDAKERKNYAGTGHKFDVARDAFIPPKSDSSAKFNEAACRWDVQADMTEIG